MRKKCMRKQWSFFLCIVLIVAMALSAAGCNGGKENQSKTGSAAEQQTESDAENGNLDEPKGEDPDGAQNENPDEADSEAADDDQTDTEGNVLGEGETQFPFTVVDQEGEETLFEIHTDKETVGEALQDVGLIEGEEGEYGLFVKTVNGITADYDKDGVYWAFYVNGEYAAEGVDSTKIAEGDAYAFKVE